MFYIQYLSSQSIPRFFTQLLPYVIKVAPYLKLVDQSAVLNVFEFRASYANTSVIGGLLLPVRFPHILTVLM